MTCTGKDLQQSATETATIDFMPDYDRFALKAGPRAGHIDKAIY